jgi:hypothetical protein
MNLNIEEEPEPWQFSHAKEKLVQRILEGEITADSNANIVYNSDPDFMVYDLRNFKTNLKNLIQSISRRVSNAEFDDAALAHDQSLFPRPNLTLGGYPFWNGSAAETALAEDIDNNLDRTITTQELWNSREVYLVFPFHIFSQHVRQERTSRTQSSYWHNRSKQKSNKKRKTNCN